MFIIFVKFFDEKIFLDFENYFEILFFCFCFFGIFLTNFQNFADFTTLQKPVSPFFYSTSLSRPTTFAIIYSPLSHNPQNSSSFSTFQITPISHPTHAILSSLLSAITNIAQPYIVVHARYAHERAPLYLPAHTLRAYTHTLRSLCAHINI